MNKKEMVEELFGFTEATFYNWKRENRPIVKLIQYLEYPALEEFLETGKIQRYENIEINEKVDEFILISAIQKIKIKSRKSGFKLKELMNPDLIESVLPLKSFLSSLYQANSMNKLLFYRQVELLDIEEGWKSIIINFTTDEISQYEFEQLIKNKQHVMTILGNEKGLNWS